MVRPPQSPDLNIIESVWDYMKRQKQLRHLNPQRNCGNFSKMQEQPTCRVPYKTVRRCTRRTGAVLKGKACSQQILISFRILLFTALCMKLIDK